jgi:hypothetical protein
MPAYTINLRGFSETVDVPPDYKGIRAVAEYIGKYLGWKYAKALVRRYPAKYPNPPLAISRLTENWMDSHIDFIQDELERLATDARKELEKPAGGIPMREVHPSYDA